MAVTLTFCITQSDDAKSFTVKDTTGEYNASSNPTGYGTPNPTIASVTAATITLSQLTDAATSTYTTPVTVSVYSTLPNITGALKTLTATNFGYGTAAQFPDAVYKITYAVTSSLGTITSVTQYKGFYSILDCCSKKLSDKLAICTCNCSGIEEDARIYSFWRRELKAADCCGNISAIMKFIEKLTRLCLDCQC